MGTILQVAVRMWERRLCVPQVQAVSTQCADGHQGRERHGSAGLQ